VREPSTLRNSDLRWLVREGFVHLQRGSDEAIVGLELLQISPPSGERLVGI